MFCSGNEPSLVGAVVKEQWLFWILELFFYAWFVLANIEAVDSINQDFGRKKNDVGNPTRKASK
jgi:hypothetical protein